MVKKKNIFMGTLEWLKKIFSGELLNGWRKIFLGELLNGWGKSLFRDTL